MSLKQIVRTETGFTLIEVIIALVVLVIGVLGVFSMQLLTIKGNSNAIALSRSVQETAAALDRAESLDYDDGELNAGNDKDMTTLFGTAQNFSGTLIYNVVDQGDDELKALYGLTHDTFPGSQCKLIQLTSTQRSSGEDRSINLQYVKVDY